ncbi:hypothetical protein PUR71_07285 [Streptomyces sp. SP17BM10]|uniref:hypothetical protein n=1 Tax=Streptomyces sp. SP17BM10 TaxID=3002530 RepID=UPI002E75BA67|nr:hypothetical protein [Streptomyces sp. SP17BM10]MEE1782725.1 hypothetical protein [Streptomyces sp. SP17BM10]
MPGDDGDHLVAVALLDEQRGEVGRDLTAWDLPKDGDGIVEAAVLGEQPRDGDVPVVDLVGGQRLDLADGLLTSPALCGRGARPALTGTREDEVSSGGQRGAMRSRPG